jgi:maltose O-acetyltransferase
MYVAARSLEARAYDAVVAAGAADVTPTQARLMAQVDPDGTRTVTLAARARITKQSAGFLVDQLERAGYVERVPDPADGRAKLVRLTRRGRAVGGRRRRRGRRVAARVGAAPRRGADARAGGDDAVAAADHRPVGLTDPPLYVGPMSQETGEKSMRERMLAGEPYIADDPVLAEESQRAQGLAHRINTMDPNDARGRRELLEELLGGFGEHSELRPPLHCDYGYQTTIGARTFVNWGATLLDVAAIPIGDDVQIGPHVQLLTATHPLDPQPRRDKWEAAQPITIGDNVWLGGGVIVCPGVTIGADTVVGAGSVVTRDLPAGVVAVGSPARVVREL